MRSLLAASLLLAIFGIPLPARAQDDASKLEIYAGYDYVHYKVHPIISGAPANESYSANGGSLQGVFNATNWLGLVADVSGYGVARHGFATTHQISYLFGPRFNLRRGRITPFAHVLLGGVWAEDGLVLGSVTAFGMTAGGGVDVALTKHISIRPAQAEYYLTTFNDGNNNRQNNFRFSAGIIFRFGGK
jgi:opacity protein-like surface antigen